MKKNRVFHKKYAAVLLLIASFVLMPAMSMRANALQDGTTPADTQDMTGDALNEIAQAETDMQGTAQSPDTPLGIQQDSLQAIQEGIEQGTVTAFSAEDVTGNNANVTEEAAVDVQATETAWSPEQEQGDPSSADLQTMNTIAASYTAEDIVGHGAKILAGSPGLYSIRINRDACTVTVYQTLVTGEQVPFRAFICSASQSTPTGMFSIQNKIGWSALAGGVYGQYCMPITGPYWFHSVPYYSMNADDLEYEEFNKLGQNVSLGCVRLKVEDVKWIFDNCEVGTPVEIYDDIKNPGPLGQPEPMRIDITSPKRGWDPTDPDLENPWKPQEVAWFNSPDKAVLIREDGITKENLCELKDDNQ